MTRRRILNQPLVSEMWLLKSKIARVLIYELDLSVRTGFSCLPGAILSTETGFVTKAKSMLVLENIHITSGRVLFSIYGMGISRH